LEEKDLDVESEILMWRIIHPVTRLWCGGVHKEQGRESSTISRVRYVNVNLWFKNYHIIEDSVIIIGLLDKVKAVISLSLNQY